jgi:hypothetical protein
MRVIIDADACTSKGIIEEVARRHNIKVLLVADTSHLIDTGNNVRAIIVDKAPQETDITIINRASKNDIVVTQDYGLASLVLGKGVYAISPRGFLFSEESISRMLNLRHIASRVRRRGGRTKGPRAYSKQDMKRFARHLERLISHVQGGEVSC